MFSFAAFRKSDKSELTVPLDTCKVCAISLWLCPLLLSKSVWLLLHCILSSLLCSIYEVNWSLSPFLFYNDVQFSRPLRRYTPQLQCIVSPGKLTRSFLIIVPTFGLHSSHNHSISSSEIPLSLSAWITMLLNVIVKVRRPCRYSHRWFFWPLRA